MHVYTIGFTQKTAAGFFGLLCTAGIKRLLDVRLNRSSQLAGFAREQDLPFFLTELCRAEYVVEPLLAPTEELMRGYRERAIDWPEYERRFMALMAGRQVEKHISPHDFEAPTVLLCSEPTADHCHRRLVLEYLQEKWGNLTIVHL